LGLYLAPGGFAEITVPSSLLNKNYKIEVGTVWTDNFREGGNPKTTHYRNDKITTTYEVKSLKTTVGNPLGGGI